MLVLGLSEPGFQLVEGHLHGSVLVPESARRPVGRLFPEISDSLSASEVEATHGRGREAGLAPTLLPDVPGLRGFFVQYTGRTVRPPMAEACERWESVTAEEVTGLEERLGRLVG